MRFMDSRGRLFGMVNLLDLLVVMVIIVLIFTMTVNVINRPKANAKAGVELLVKVMVRVPNEVARNPDIFKAKDRVLAGNAVIEKILEIKPVSNDSGYSDVIVSIRADCVVLNNEYYCANAPIKINSLINIANPVYIFNQATIVDVKKEDK